MTSQVEVPPLTGLIHFISGKRRVKYGTVLDKWDIQKYFFLILHKKMWYSLKHLWGDASSE